jgi:hypothetical protein
MLGLERSLGSCIVTYADDLVPEQGRGGARPDARAHGQAEADGQQKRRAPQDLAAQLNRLGFRDVIHLAQPRQPLATSRDVTIFYALLASRSS